MEKTRQPTNNISSAVEVVVSDGYYALDCVDGYGNPCIAFYATTAGNVVLDTVFGETKTVPVGAFQLIPLQAAKLYGSDGGSTVTKIVALFNEERKNRQS